MVSKFEKLATGLLTLILFCAPVLIYLYAALNPSQNVFSGITQHRFLNSDTLAFVDFAEAIFVNRENPFAWYWGTHWFLFPDLLLEGLGLNLGASHFSALYSVGIVNYSIFAIAVYLSLRRNIFLASAITGIYGFVGELGVMPFSDLWLPGMHSFYMSAAVIIILTTGSVRLKGPRLFFISLTSFSNELFFIAMSLYVLLLALIYLLRGQLRVFLSERRSEIRELIVSGATSLLGFFTLSNHYDSFWQLHPSKMNVENVRFFLSSQPIVVFILALNVCLLSIYIHFQTSGRLSLQNRMSYERVLLLIAGFLLAIIPTFSSNLPWVPRYATLLLLFGVPLILGEIVRTDNKKNENKRQTHFKSKAFFAATLTFGLFAPTLVGQIAKTSFVPSENDACIINEIQGSIRDQDPINVGAGYWDARRLQALVRDNYSKSQIRFIPMEPNGDNYKWMTDKRDTKLKPNLILANLQNPWFTDSFLRKLEIAQSECENYSLYLGSSERGLKLKSGEYFIYSDSYSLKVNDSWYAPEEWGTWGKGTRSYIDFEGFGSDTPERIIVRFYIPGNKNEARRVQIDLNNAFTIGRVKVNQNTNNEIKVNLTEAHKNLLSSRFRLSFNVDKSFKPSSNSTSSDTRNLGIGLASIKFD